MNAIFPGQRVLTLVGIIYFGLLVQDLHYYSLRMYTGVLQCAFGWACLRDTGR